MQGKKGAAGDLPGGRGAAPAAGGGSRRARSAAAWELARRQHGILTRRDLLALGYGSGAIERRLAGGRLHRVAPGIYAVGWPDLTPKQRWMAAVLACGEGALLSHRSAAALWGIGKEPRDCVEVSVRRRRKGRRAGIKVRARPSLPEGDVVLRELIPVTCPARTLIDLATVLSSRALERAVNEADKFDLIDPEALRAALENYTGEPGVRPLRTLLDRHTFRLSDTDLEVLFRPIAASAGLPSPQTKAGLNGYEVDFFWPELRLVVETDGLRYHRTASAQTRDHRRDQIHTATGYTALRFTHYEVRYEPAHVRRILELTARGLS